MSKNSNNIGYDYEIIVVAKPTPVPQYDNDGNFTFNIFESRVYQIYPNNDNGKQTPVVKELCHKFRCNDIMEENFEDFLNHYDGKATIDDENTSLEQVFSEYFNGRLSFCMDAGDIEISLMNDYENSYLEETEHITEDDYDEYDYPNYYVCVITEYNR